MEHLMNTLKLLYVYPELFLLLCLLPSLFIWLRLKGSQRLWFGRLIVLVLRSYILKNSFRKGEEFSSYEREKIQAQRKLSTDRDFAIPGRRFYDAKR